MPSTASNISNAIIKNPVTAFGELSVAQNTAYIQAICPYDLIPANFREFTFGTGTTGAENEMYKVTSGTSPYGYGAIQSFRALNYRTGQGGLARFTALFEGSAENSQQGAGLFNISDELSFGYDGTVFGIWYRHHGLAECHELQITAGANAGQNITLTLNGVAYVIPVTSGTANFNAWQIEEWLNANQTVWHADQLGDKVIISAYSDGPKSGSYSFASSGNTTGAITLKNTGVLKTNDFIPRTEWNGQDASWLNPQFGNVYQIRYQYLGFGAIKFYVEEPSTGEFILVHTIRYANSETRPSLRNPSLHIGLYAYNANKDNTIGSSTDLVVRSASMSAFSEGLETRTRNPRSEKHTQSISATATNVFTNILTIRNRRTYNYKINQVEAEPLKMTISNEGSKNVEVVFRGNPTLVSGSRDFQGVGNSNLVVDADKSSNTFSGGRPLDSVTLAPGQSIIADLSALRTRIPPTLKISIGGRVTGGGQPSPISTSLTWYEDLS